MKKIATIAAVALLGVIVLPSCKKDYTCECTWSMDGKVIQTQEFSLGKQTKSKAKDACSQKVDMGGSLGASVTAECKLK